jgi:hypothetical protein
MDVAQVVHGDDSTGDGDLGGGGDDFFGDLSGIGETEDAAAYAPGVGGDAQRRRGRRDCPG